MDNNEPDSALDIDNHETSIRNLKKVCKIDYYSGSGSGGQHRNRHYNCVRVFYPPLGITVVATEHRSQYRNRKLAFKRLIEKIHEASAVKPERKPTSVPCAVKEKVKRDKIMQSIKKRMREKFKLDE